MKLAIDTNLFIYGIFDSSYKFPGISITNDRTVNNFEIEIYTEFGGTTYINGNAYKLRPGLIICARPGDIRHSELPTKCFYVKISPKLHEISELFIDIDRAFYSEDSSGCAEIVKDMLRADAEDDPLLESACLLKFISKITREFHRYRLSDSTQRENRREAIGLAIDYMEKHFREKIDLADVAAFAHFSPAHFHRLFCKTVGKSPLEYLTRLRIEEAKRILLCENALISDVAERSGFASQSYFNYIFKKETGVTPGTYRRQNIAKYCI